MALGRHTYVPRDTAGSFYPAGPVTVYEAGTTTLATLYQDDDGDTAGSNPTLTHQDTGVWSAVLAAGLYDFVHPDGTVLPAVPVAPFETAAAALMAGDAPDIEDAATDFADLAAVTTAYNALLAALRTRGVLAAEET